MALTQAQQFCEVSTNVGTNYVKIVFLHQERCEVCDKGTDWTRHYDLLVTWK